jgi:hypothetical protein
MIARLISALACALLKMMLPPFSIPTIHPSPIHSSLRPSAEILIRLKGSKARRTGPI